MYLTSGQGYYDASGQQHARRGRFLILMQDKNQPCGRNNIRAIVRKVALSQCGHWMMGRVRIGARWYTVSGSYGDDGLPMNVESDAYALGVPLPTELYDAWNKGNGWNSCGSEATAMRKWALETFKD